MCVCVCGVGGNEDADYRRKVAEYFQLVTKFLK